jgi:hypothetical protein
MQVNVHFNEIKDEIISNLKKAKSEIKVAVAWQRLTRNFS